MALHGLELHHHAIRMRPGLEDAQLGFFREVLGMEPDPESRSIPDVPLFWFDVGNDTQIHTFAVEGVSKYAFAPDLDPFCAHVALGCPDVEQAREELDRLGVEYWCAGKGERQQLFTNDPSGNMIELHQIGTCRCKASDR
jgi:catechol 2,3-dioxygenase-like lactoylglutathione lyase family enzyme